MKLPWTFAQTISSGTTIHRSRGASRRRRTSQRIAEKSATPNSCGRSPSVIAAQPNAARVEERRHADGPGSAPAEIEEQAEGDADERARTRMSPVQPRAW